MTKMILLISICCMMVNTGCLKAAELRDGVYECEFTEIDSDPIREFSHLLDNPYAPDTIGVCWTLTVIDGEALFHIKKEWPRDGYINTSNHGDYLLKPEKQPDGSMTAEVIIEEKDKEEGLIIDRGGLNRDIKLIFRNINPNSVDVEIVEGTIWKRLSASGVYHHVIPLTPETQTLTFVRELSDEDKETFTRVKLMSEENNF